MKNFDKKDYLSNLNTEQREAVTTTDGPVLIVAGAGAGKTKTIIHRIVYLIQNGVPPEKILAITFTNKAAKEMRERIVRFLENDDELKALTHSGMPMLSTFHALGVFILKTYGDRIGLSRYFTIYDKTDGKRAIKEATIQANYDPKQFDSGKIQHAISRAKGEGMTLSQYKENMGNEYFESVVLSIWTKYETILSKEGALDFDDLLLKALGLLENFEDVRNACQQRWQYVHIDEYQDTNKVQDTIAQIISKKHHNLCVVGDTDQNIYSWRGADIKNMLQFEKKHPNVKIIRLEENYRSTKTILAVANKIIQKNKYRIDKKLFTNNAEGDKVGLIENYDETQEAHATVNKIRALMDSGTVGNEIAVLYRANFQSRALEEALLAQSVPYQMLGTRFFERKEIKDTLSYIRASLNPASVSDLKRIINVPARGIGKTTVEKVFAGQEHELSASAQSKLSLFRAILMRIKEESLLKNASELIKYTIEQSGIEKVLDIKNEEDAERLENIKELVTLALSYDVYGVPEGIERLLTDASLATDEETSEEKEKAVKLMTVHSAKGLEFDCVFVTGLEDGLFPHRKYDAGISAEDAEEERRLFYVAVTRARKKLFLSYAQTRTIFGSRQVNIPSEFIFDIEDIHMEREEPSADTYPKKPLFKIDF